MKNIYFILFFIIFYSCGKENLPEKTYTKIKTPLNGVKYISSVIKNGKSEDTYAQGYYDLAENSRLLLRLENLTNIKNVIIDDEKKMFLIITGRSYYLENTLKLCPLKKNWMMLSTWDKAHPFPGESSKWTKPGGDFDPELCLSPQYSNDGEKDILSFEISDWFLSLATSQQNYGHILVSDTNFQIYGDKHPKFSPRLNWMTENDNSF